MGHLLMSKKERRRQVVMSNVISGTYSLREGTRLLGLSYRQALRIKQRYELLGDSGLLHRRRGQASNRQFSDTFKSSVLARYQERYEGFGPTFASEKLAEDGQKINRETLRGWLIEAGLWEKKARKYTARSRRPRRERFGDLLQIDGSIHRWFGDDRYTCLFNAVDDATSATYAIMREGETTEGALSLLKGWIDRYGIPKAVYVDLKNVYVGGSQANSVFLEVCKRLGIELIKAYSPQAKGRVERSHGVYQDRLVKEIGLRNLQHIDEVNAFLETEFVDGLNQRFAKLPPKPQTGHAPVLEGQMLGDVFYKTSDRQVQNDWTIRYQGTHYQLEDTQGIRAKSYVSVRCYLDGDLRVYAKDQRVTFAALEGSTERPKLPTKALKERVCYRPANDHPWRHYKEQPQAVASR